MVGLLIVGGFFALILCGLTGELIQTQVFHNTVPIAQRGAMSDLMIGVVVWLVIAGIVLAIRWRIKESKKLIEQHEAQARAIDKGFEDERRAKEDAEEKATRARKRLQQHIAAGGFTEDISTPSFAREWKAAYEKIIFWETEIETLWRWRAQGTTTEGKIAPELKEADERLNDILKDWSVRHPGAPRPEVRYYDVK